MSDMDEKQVFDGIVHAAGSWPVVLSFDTEVGRESSIRFTIDEEYTHSVTVPATRDYWVYVTFWPSVLDPDKSYFKSEMYDHEEPFF